MIITFCGNSQIWGECVMEKVRMKLYEVIEELRQRGTNTFYLGGYGRFDSLAAVAVRQSKKKHPHIESVFITPYLNTSRPTELYDTVIYPPLEKVPLRYAISKRNQWMIRQSDVVVAYVDYTWGNSYQMLTYAIKKGKEIIDINKKTPELHIRSFYGSKLLFSNKGEQKKSIKSISSP